MVQTFDFGLYIKRWSYASYVCILISLLKCIMDFFLIYCKFKLELEIVLIIIYLNAWLLLQLLLEPDWSSIMMICDAIRQGDTNPK